jgi:two-component system LytT family response regulator
MSEELRIVIVDDEPPALSRLAELLKHERDIQIVGECASGEEAIAAVRSLKPDIVFLDIQMPELDGFGVLAKLEPGERPAGIIFVTAYDTYAVRAFDLNAVDYLLKPYTAERFSEALERARLRIGTHATPDPRIDDLLRAVARRPERSERLPVRSRDGVEFVTIDDIDWLQSDRNYTVLHVGRSEMRVRETISELEGKLGDRGFIRIHRSIVVNSDRIFRIEPWGSSEHLIIMRDGTKIQTGRAYDERLKRLLR